MLNVGVSSIVQGKLCKLLPLIERDFNIQPSVLEYLGLKKLCPLQFVWTITIAPPEMVQFQSMDFYYYIP